MGAGVIPFAVEDNQVRFLFQSTFTGRKVGHFIDFGGGLGSGEGYREAAIREFVEETETLYFAKDPDQANRSEERIRSQIPVVSALFDKTLEIYPDWWCQRAPGNPLKPRLWKTFFIEFPYRDIQDLNHLWQADRIGRFKKRRELFWVTADKLLEIYQHHPEKLWKRVRQLENVTELIEQIRQAKLT